MDDRFVNLGEEIILTLLWQSGASETATVCFVISLNICYWLFKCGVLRVVCERECHITASCVCVCSRVWERETRSHNRGLCTANTYENHHHVSHATLFPFTFILKAKAHDYGKGLYISDAACGVRPITMHCVSWPIRADCACRKEGLCRKRSVWERRGIEDLQ